MPALLYLSKYCYMRAAAGIDTSGRIQAAESATEKCGTIRFLMEMKLRFFYVLQFFLLGHHTRDGSG